MSKIIKKILLLIFVSILIISSLTTNNFTKKKNKKESYIEKVLTKKEYNYLPKNAKNYIKNVYLETGEVIRTEKNKEENIPYLNPNFINYLSLSDSEKEKNKSDTRGI